jgi:hypothetical protein
MAYRVCSPARQQLLLQRATQRYEARAAADKAAREAREQR